PGLPGFGGCADREEAELSRRFCPAGRRPRGRWLPRRLLVALRARSTRKRVLSHAALARRADREDGQRDRPARGGGVASRRRTARPPASRLRGGRCLALAGRIRLRLRAGGVARGRLLLCGPGDL